MNGTWCRVCDGCGDCGPRECKKHDPILEALLKAIMQELGMI